MLFDRTLRGAALSFHFAQSGRANEQKGRGKEGIQWTRIIYTNTLNDATSLRTCIQFGSVASIHPPSVVVCVVV
jgi:hypothetical protein